LNSSYTFRFIDFNPKWSDGFLVKSFMVNSNERKNDVQVISARLDLMFKMEDVRKLPTNDLLEYFRLNMGSFKEHISFDHVKNHSELTEEEVKQCIIDSFLEYQYIEEVFWRLEDILESLCISERAIRDGSYEIEVIEKHKISIEINEDEQFVLELKGEGEDAKVDCFSYYYLPFSDPISVVGFLEKNVEEAFFKDVLKKTRIRRLVAPSKTN